MLFLCLNTKNTSEELKEGQGMNAYKLILSVCIFFIIMLKSLFMKNSNYYAVIMAGGVGSRFWPLSTQKFPKVSRRSRGRDNR